MEVVISIEVRKHVSDEEYANLFDSKEKLAADVELFRQETLEDMYEVFPNADEIHVSVVGIDSPGEEE